MIDLLIDKISNPHLIEQMKECLCVYVSNYPSTHPFAFTYAYQLPSYHGAKGGGQVTLDSSPAGRRAISYFPLNVLLADGIFLNSRVYSLYNFNY